MEKCSQKRPRCRWLAWCSGPPAPRVTALACTTCSSFPIRQTYTCGNGGLQKNIYMKKIFGNTWWCDLPGPGGIRSKLGTTSSWHEPSHVSSPERSSLLEKKGVFIHSCSPGRGITHRDAVSFLLWHHLHFYVFNLVLLLVDVPFPKTQSWNEKLSTSTDQVIR